MKRFYPRNRWLTLAVVTLLPIAAVAVQARNTSGIERRIFLWYPTDDDLEAGSAKLEVLRSILAHAIPDMYQVRSGDSLDLIVRTRFAVSQSDQPNAYQLYVQEIQARNRKKLDVLSDPLVPNLQLELPQGPRYSRTSLKDKLSPFVWSTQTQSRLFRQMNRTALLFRGSEPEFEAKIARVSKHLVRSGEYQGIAALALVSPVDSKRAPVLSDSQVQIVETTYSQTEEPPAETLSAFVPANTNQDEECGTTCTECRTLLPSLDGIPLEKSRVAVFDSGIDMSLGLKNSPQLLFAPSNDFNDILWNKHGTYVYTELVRNLHGILPTSSVFVAKIADRNPDDGTVEYSLRHFVSARVQFTAQLSKAGEKDRARTAIVNISAEGPSNKPEIPLLDQPNVLYIAAAGNHHNDVDPERNLFAEINKPELNVIIVGALTHDGKTRAPYSNYHRRNVDIYAQGSCVCGSPDQLNGTSQAAPVVTIAAAALSAKHVKWTPQEIKWRLLGTSDIDDKLEGVGGRLNLARALENGIQVVIQKGSDVNVINGSSLATTSPTLKALLLDDSRHPVVRLHRIPGPTGVAIFKILAVRAGSSTPVVPGDEEVSVETSQGIIKVKAADIQDLFLPVKQLVTDNAVTDGDSE